MTEILFGITIGWAAGISPGPLNLLIVQSALRSGAVAGALVAVSPLVTDAPIVAVSILVASNIPDSALTALSVGGGLYLVWLGVSEWRTSGADAVEIPAGSHLRRGVVANLLSPHPYLFWLTVGGPTIVTTWGRSPTAAIGFLVAFFAVLVGVKVVIAVLVARAGRRLTDRGRLLAARIGGAALVAVGVAVVAGRL